MIILGQGFGFTCVPKGFIGSIGFPGVSMGSVGFLGFFWGVLDRPGWTRNGPGWTWTDPDGHGQTRMYSDRPGVLMGSKWFCQTSELNGCGIRIGELESEDIRTFYKL